MAKKGYKLPTKHSYRRFAFIVGATLFITVPPVGAFLYLVYSSYETTIINSGNTEAVSAEVKPESFSFPVGVMPLQKMIVEQSNVEEFMFTHITKVIEPKEIRKLSIVRKAISKLALFDWYQNLAAGGSRILIIEPGERREEIAAHFGKILKWTKEDEREFLTSVVSSDPIFLEGKFIPGSYIVARNAEPGEVAPLVSERFITEIINRYPDEVALQVPLADALTIASLLEREAYDFEDMRFIAGVIWNRLFIDMHLQIDATLQYAKGTASLTTWWPKPIPDDKYIDSPFNTYKNKGLPPTPIGNPSPLSLLAALNPRQTECLYYFHDSDGGFHCTTTYQQHVELLKKYYGRGK